MTVAADLTAIRAALDLDAKATPGEWETRRESYFVQVRAARDLEELVTTQQATGTDLANAASIAALHNAAPAIRAAIDELEVARAKLAEVEAKLAEALDLPDANKSIAASNLSDCARLSAEVDRLTAELEAARAVPADVEAAIASVVDDNSWPDYDRGAPSIDALRAAIARAIAEARAPLVEVCRYLDCSAADLLAVVTSLYETRARAISDATAARGTATAVPRCSDAGSGTGVCVSCSTMHVVPTARGTVGGLLAAGEERELRAWSEKGKAPPGSCPFCASRISMVQRDGYFIARCSHRGCGAVGPRMRSVSRAADLFCQPPRREAQGMSCGPIVASPQRPRCSCTHEAGDSRCNVHPTCSECGASTTRPVDGCEACRGPLPKGG